MKQHCVKISFHPFFFLFPLQTNYCLLQGRYYKFPIYHWFALVAVKFVLIFRGTVLFCARVLIALWLQIICVVDEDNLLCAFELSFIHHLLEIIKKAK